MLKLIIFEKPPNKTEKSAKLCFSKNYNEKPWRVTVKIVNYYKSINQRMNKQIINKSINQ